MTKFSIRTDLCLSYRLRPNSHLHCVSKKVRCWTF